MSPSKIAEPCPLHILIVGGGLAGLGAALALNQAGHRVTVFERMPEFHQVGAGIQLSPNATRTLRTWGVLDHLLSHSYQPETGGLRSWRNGTFLSRALPPATETLAAYKAPYIVVHRADLLKALVSAARTRTGITIRLDSNVSKLDISCSLEEEKGNEGGTTAVHLSTGERIEGDFILGADGERSFCRNVLLGRPDLPKPTGDVVFRIAVPRGDIVADKTHPSSEVMRRGSVNVWMGPDAHAVSYLMHNNDILNLVLIRKENKSGCIEADDAIYGPQRADLEELRRAFTGWDPALRALLDVPGRSECMKWNLLQINELDSWRHPQYRHPSSGGKSRGGNFCLIGDAAHGMPPFLAQSGAMAFEDAAVLGAIFEQISDTRLIPDALEAFETVRKPRVDKVKERTLARKVMYGLHDGPEQRLRDEKLALGLENNESPDDLARADFQKWLWGYDAAADGARAWERRLQSIQ